MQSLVTRRTFHCPLQTPSWMVSWYDSALPQFTLSTWSLRDENRSIPTLFISPDAGSSASMFHLESWYLSEMRSSPRVFSALRTPRPLTVDEEILWQPATNLSGSRARGHWNVQRSIRLSPDPSSTESSHPWYDGDSALPRLDRVSTIW